MIPSVQDTNEAIISLIIEHITTTGDNFEKYFPLFNTEQFDWIRNSFVYSDFFSFRPVSHLPNRRLNDAVCTTLGVKNK